MHCIYIICGKSGVGKTTIVNNLSSRYSLKKMFLYSTRPQRNIENGKVFITDEDIVKLKNIVVDFTFNNYRYLGVLSNIEESDIFDMAPSGIVQIKSSKLIKKKIKVIYVDAPDCIRIERMRNRGETEDFIAEREVYEKNEFRHFQDIVDFNIENINLEDCLMEIWNYICKQENMCEI